MGLQIKTQLKEKENIRISGLKEGTIFKSGNQIGIRTIDAGISEYHYKKVLAINLATGGTWVADYFVDEILPKGTILEII